jgi:hypothetical protein
MKRFLNFCGYVFGLGKARVIFGPEPSQWWQPISLKNIF